MITSYNFSVCDATILVLNTKSPIHIYDSLQRLQISRKFEKSERLLNVGDERAVLILAIKNVQLVLNSNVIVLDDCHYYPSLLMNIIFIGLLAKDDYNFSINFFL